MPGGIRFAWCFPAKSGRRLGESELREDGQGLINLKLEREGKGALKIKPAVEWKQAVIKVSFVSASKPLLPRGWRRRNMRSGRFDFS